MTVAKNLYRNYQDWKSWDDLFVYSADQAGYFEAEMADLSIEGAAVLEIGFGSGSCVAWMERKGAKVTVTEINESSCTAARNRGLGVLSPNLPEIAHDHFREFDTIVAFDVFEHLGWHDVDEFLHACAIMLKDGGRLLLRFPNAQSPFGLVPQAGDPTHRVGLSLAAFRLFLVKYPYNVVRYSSARLNRGKFLTAVWLKRTIRRVLQLVIGKFLAFTYATKIPYEPVVVLVLEKNGRG